MVATQAIESIGLTKTFGSQVAVDCLNLEVEPGEMFGFLGPNGAGKTTTILLLAGFLRPTEGRLSVFGLDSWHDSLAISKRLGFVPDLSALYIDLTGHELLSYLGSLHGVKGAHRRTELCDALEISDADLARRIKEYSHGMKRKLAIIQAMQHDPDLLVMDEPTQGLDPIIQQSFFSIIRDSQRRGATIFFSSHVLSEVEELCERVAIIRGGALITAERVEELRTRRRRKVMIKFTGTPPDNFLTPGVEVVFRDGTAWTLSVGTEIGLFLRELANYDLEDVTVERPRLEDIFLEYY